MRITGIETFVCDAGWRPWTFVKVLTDAGVVGYGECSDGRNPRGVVGCIDDLRPLLLGRDPRAVERLNADMYRVIRQSPGGIAQKAIAGIDTALWDIKGKALGVPVYELLGGPTRDRVRLYWSHCGTSRARHWELLGVPPLRGMADIAALGREVVERGFTALKTNIVVPGDPATVYGPGFGGDDANGYDLTLSPAMLRHTVDLIGTFRAAVGPDVGIALDLNFNFKTEGFARIAKALEPFDLMWLEIDTYEPDALAWIKASTTTRICSGENLFTARDYRPFLDRQAMDVAMIDVPWNGFTASKKIADLVATYEVNIAPHNYYSHLSTLLSAHLCAVSTNVRIMEIDIDDVPWKDDLLTEPLDIRDGHLHLPARPGWGADLNEREIARHPWPA
ncbi:MAG: mandelate racemase/muconate lactonizing enzyme family protein [Chloroflexi bacterium]|nr:mandelate racemase/muconate lactonizing enzyme family protein [Chloroflexota bacterium]